MVVARNGWGRAGGLRGQGSVEYLFIVVFLTGFVVSILVPTLQQSEITFALAAARDGAVSSVAGDTLRLTRLNYSVYGGEVAFRPSVYNLSSDSAVQAPPQMVAAMVSAVHRLAPSSSFNATCANTSNYQYCVLP